MLKVVISILRGHPSISYLYLYNILLRYVAKLQDAVLSSLSGFESENVGGMLESKVKV